MRRDDRLESDVREDLQKICAIDLCNRFFDALMVGINRDEDIFFVNAGQSNDDVVVVQAFFAKNFLICTICPDDFNTRKIP